MKIICLEGREPFGMYLKVLARRNFLILLDNLMVKRSLFHTTCLIVNSTML